MGGTPRTKARLICRLAREAKQYPIRKQANLIYCNLHISTGLMFYFFQDRCILFISKLYLVFLLLFLFYFIECIYLLLFLFIIVFYVINYVIALACSLF